MISGLNKSSNQSQKATYAGLVSKELYYEFKVIFQKLMQGLKNFEPQVLDEEVDDHFINKTDAKDTDNQEDEKKYEVIIGYK